MSTRTTAPSARPPLRVAFHLPSADLTLDGATPRWSDILALARRAEEAGFDGVSLGEHFLIHHGGQTLGGWDSWSLLAGLAAATARIDLTLLVTATTFRNPALIAGNPLAGVGRDRG